MLADKVQSLTLRIILKFLDNELKFSLAVLLNEGDSLLFGYLYNFDISAILRIPDNLEHISDKLYFNKHFLPIHYLLFDKSHLIVFGFVKSFAGYRSHSTGRFDIGEIEVYVCHSAYRAFVLDPLLVQFLGV